jgi:hypothetical protein
MSERGTYGPTLDWAKDNGHTEVELLKLKDGRHYCLCSCGYRSTGRQGPGRAMQAWLHHVDTLRRAESVNGGVSLPGKRAASA